MDGAGRTFRVLVSGIADSTLISLVSMVGNIFEDDRRMKIEVVPEIVPSTNVAEAFGGVRIAILGSNQESQIRAQAEALSQHAAEGVKILLLRGNHVKTFCQHAATIPAKDITWLSRLALDVACRHAAQRANRDHSNIHNIIVWGTDDNLGVDLEYASVYTQNGMRPLRNLVNDDDWLAGEFITTVLNVAAAAIGAGSEICPLSVANAICEHLHDWLEGTVKMPSTTDVHEFWQLDEWASMGVISDGSYGVPEGEPYSFPVTCKKGEWSIVQGLNMPFIGGEPSNEVSTARGHGILATCEEWSMVQGGESSDELPTASGHGLRAQGRFSNRILPEEVLELIFLCLPAASLRKCCLLSHAWEQRLCSHSFWDAWMKKNANCSFRGRWLVSTQPAGIDYEDREGNLVYLPSWVVALHQGTSGTWHKLPDELLAGRDSRFLAGADGLIVSCSLYNRPVVFNPCTMWSEVLPPPYDEVTTRWHSRRYVSMLRKRRGIVLLSDNTYVYEAASKEWHEGPKPSNLNLSSEICCHMDDMFGVNEDGTLARFSSLDLKWRFFQVQLLSPVVAEFDRGNLWMHLVTHLFTDGVSLMTVGWMENTEGVAVCKLELGPDDQYHRKLVAKLDDDSWNAYCNSHPQEDDMNVWVYFFGEGDVVHCFMQSFGLPKPPMFWWNFRTGECGRSSLSPFGPTTDKAPLPVVFEPRFDAKF